MYVYEYVFMYVFVEVYGYVYAYEYVNMLICTFVHMYIKGVSFYSPLLNFLSVLPYYKCGVFS